MRFQGSKSSHRPMYEATDRYRMADIFIDFSWQYLNVMEAGRAPLSLLAVGMLAAVWRMRHLPQRSAFKCLVWLNYGISLQFALMVAAWLWMAMQVGREYFYLIFAFILSTWTCLPFFMLAALASFWPRPVVQVCTS